MTEHTKVRPGVRERVEAILDQVALRERTEASGLNALLSGARVDEMAVGGSGGGGGDDSDFDGGDDEGDDDDGDEGGDEGDFE